jgi:hypothetical protein
VTQSLNGTPCLKSQETESLEYDKFPAQKGRQALHLCAIADEECWICYSAEWCRLDHNKSSSSFNYKINME